MAKSRDRRRAEALSSALGDGLRKEAPRGENPSRHSHRSSETSDRGEAQIDRWKPLRGAESVHFSRVCGESVLGRTDSHFRCPKGAGTRRRGDRSVRGRLDSRTNERTQSSRSSAESKIVSLAEKNADEEGRVESPKRVERRENAPCTECATAARNRRVRRAR